jgi:hypothetical protein
MLSAAAFGRGIFLALAALAWALRRATAGRDERCRAGRYERCRASRHVCDTGAEEVDMESSTPRSILIVAYRTAGTPGLLDEVRRRAAQGRCRFVLLVPRPYWDPETEEAALTLELAIPLLEEATGGPVEGVIGDTDPFVAVRETLEREPFDEVIVSTLPVRVSHWLRRDLPSRVEQLGVPVTVVTAKTSSRRLLAER